jgi:hypothetical protein
MRIQLLATVQNFTKSLYRQALDKLRENSERVGELEHASLEI